MAKAESKNAGFIFLHRSVRDHWIWEDSVKFKWWCDILMECNHSDQKVSFGYDLIDCYRGQSLNSLLTWAKLWRVDVSTVRRFFNLLERDEMIETENVLKTTRLTVCNYENYNTIATPPVSEKSQKKSKKSTKQLVDGDEQVLESTPLTVEDSNDYNDERHAKQFGNNSEAIPTQFGSNSDAIQTITNKNDNNEEEYFTEKEKKDFLKFEKWIEDNAPRVAKMKEPFTIRNFIELKNKAPAASISDMLRKMHNYEPLLQKNRSAYLTILNWLKRNINGNDSGNIGKKPIPTGTVPTGGFGSL